MQEKLQSAIWRKQTLNAPISSVTGRRSVNSRRLRWSWRKGATKALSCRSKRNYENPSAKEKQTLTVSDITTTVAALVHRWQRRKKTNFLLHFRVLHLRNLSINPTMRRSQDQQLLSLCLWLLEALSWLRNRSIVLVNAGLSLSRMILKQILTRAHRGGVFQDVKNDDLLVTHGHKS